PRRGARPWRWRGCRCRCRCRCRRGCGRTQGPPEPQHLGARDGTEARRAGEFEEEGVAAERRACAAHRERAVLAGLCRGAFVCDRDGRAAKFSCNRAGDVEVLRTRHRQLAHCHRGSLGGKRESCMAAFGNFHFYLEKRTATRLSADVRPAPAHHHNWTAQPGAPFHREANAYDAPPSPGIGTSTTFERSRTGEPLLSLLF